MDEKHLFQGLGFKSDVDEARYSNGNLKFENTENERVSYYEDVSINREGL